MTFKPGDDRPLLRTVEIHTPQEVAAEVEVLRADTAEIVRLVCMGVLRPTNLEADLKTEAYNRLTNKMGK